MESRAAAEGVETALARVKPSVRALGAYTLRPYAARIKLNQNESPFDVPDEVKARIAARLAERPWNRYPPFVAADFRGAVREATGWPEDGVLVANGSNELIQAILAVTVGPGVNVVIPEPTFTLYRLMTEVNGGTVVSVPLTREGLRFDVDAIARAAKESDAAVTVVCTPNNPTGASLAEAEIVALYDAVPGLLLLDQAYVEFGGFDAVPLLAGRPRMVVLRTFSKAMSMAGLRAGYLLADPALATQVDKAKLPYNVNFVTEVAAAEVLRARDLLAPAVNLLRAERDRIAAALREMPGLAVYDSDANFLLFRVAPGRIAHTTLFQRLRDEHGVLIRDVSGYAMLERCLRVNAGTPEENDAFLAGMRAILNEGEAP